MHKNKAEVVMDTTYDSFYKHGYRSIEKRDSKGNIINRKYIPGVIRETLAAASIIESGILERAHQTKKLYVWDPFWGSCTFLIEILQMLKEEPLKRENMKFCFEHWPIFKTEEFEETKNKIFEKFTNYELPRDIDIRVIGSDKRFITDSIEQSGIDKYRYSPNFKRDINFRDNPLLFSYHLPKLNRSMRTQLSDYIESDEKAVGMPAQNSLVSQESPFFSLYKGDFETVGQHLINWYGSLKDFNIITNVPYGKQIMHPKRAKSTRRMLTKGKLSEADYKKGYMDIQQLFRRFGKFVSTHSPDMNDHIYVVARKMQFSNPLCFEKFSNIEWDHRMNFTNGGINVNLLKYNSYKINRTRAVQKVYEEDWQKVANKHS